MTMTLREAFRFGFLMRCAEEGLSADETAGRVKSAAFVKAADPTDFMTGLGSLVNSAANLGAGGIVGAGLLGGAGGYAAAKLTEPDYDPNEAKTQELIATYRLYGDAARRAARRRAATAAAPAGRRLLR